MKPIHLSYAVALAGLNLVTSGRVLLQLFALELGATPGEVGVLFTTFFVFPLVIALPLGMLADRRSARGLMAIGMAIGMAGMLLPVFVHHKAALYLAGFANGITFVFTSVLTQNITGLLSRPEERARHFSNASLVGASTLMLGPLVAGFSIDLVGNAPACLSAVAFGVAGIGLLARWGGLFPLPPALIARGAGTATEVTSAASAEPRVGVLERLRKSLTDRTTLPFILVAGILHFAQDLYQFYLPVYGHGLGLSASVIGIILSSLFVMSVLVRFWMPTLVARIGEERMLIGAFLLGAVGFALTPFLTHPVGLCLVAAVLGLGMGCGSPVIMILIFSRAPEGRSGEMVGMRNTVNNLGRAGAPPLFGFIASVAGLVPVFIITAVMMAGGAWLMQSMLDRGRRAGLL